MNLSMTSKGLESPIEKESQSRSRTGGGSEDVEPVTPEGARNFRGVAARANYLSLDRPDVQYAAKESSRDMAQPVRDSWNKLKRLARYLLQYPRLVWRFEDDGRTGEEYLDIYSDSDWAGDGVRRRSTSGGHGCAWRRCFEVLE